MTRAATLYRLFVLLLAAFYALRMLVFGDWSGFGGPFRYLTIWALFLSLFCAVAMYRLSTGRSTGRWDGLVAATAVINAMVVALFWRLYLADPASVLRDGQLGDWWIELYLHGAGPLLQWIDVLVVHRGFRRPLAGLAWLVGLVVGYLTWAEVVVGPMNATPQGSVTSGLPYPFLNDLAFDGRMAFYVTNIGAGIVLLVLFTGLAWTLRRLVPRAP
ncbi:FAR-17a/AIG1-like protein [Loktanella fryxellensis]|uniref:FAR-17a/AIG1-like protein n=1 Tax=Loktanella fryxellensis TaxID=245187 RepID=A0A1H8J376_9RHOB|nr:hypothetical protein [Loktanella fryxellensis]SEN75109.1 FAR-17a/AIG1-like protein [Loktanella fryxellensis]